ncbi:MAG: hypothetical protein C0407_09310, partial [Desulfobacca sp.]|nr:hypothetical protein [Desulfobacca sp.]
FLISVWMFWVMGVGGPDVLAMGSNKDGPPQKNQAQKSSSPVPELVQLILPAGTSLKVQLNQSIRTSTHRTGQSFFATLKEPLLLGDKTVFPAGIPFIGNISKIVESGNFSGTALIELQLVRVILPDQSTYPLTTKLFQKSGRTHLIRNIGIIGTGAILGAGLGTLLGKTFGALTGIGLGGGIGTVLAYVTGKEDLFLKAGTDLVFTLSGPMTVSNSSASSMPLKVLGKNENP